jgi:hypothetical protein
MGSIPFTSGVEVTRTACLSTSHGKGSKEQADHRLGPQVMEREARGRLITGWGHVLDPAREIRPFPPFWAPLILYSSPLS